MCMQRPLLEYVLCACMTHAEVQHLLDRDLWRLGEAVDLGARAVDRLEHAHIHYSIIEQASAYSMAPMRSGTERPMKVTRRQHSER